MHKALIYFDTNANVGVSAIGFHSSLTLFVNSLECENYKLIMPFNSPKGMGNFIKAHLFQV